ncbi:MAG: cardiolipin synthase [Gammaproteobacteria bacterium]
MHPDVVDFSAIALAAHVLVVAGVGLRVLSRRLPVGTTLAWLLLAFTLPAAGVALYLFIGENRLGQRRGEQWKHIHELYQDWQRRLVERSVVDWEVLHPRARPLARLGQSISGFPALPGHEVKLLSSWDAFIDALVADIEGAVSSCHLEFYIWDSPGRVGEIYSALARAAARGVTCRVLVDAVGSKPFLASPEAAGLRKVGVRVVAALPVGLLRMLLVRMDLRNHRKLAVIDGRVGYAGSANLADPKHFKREAGVGPWVDAMIRFRGPAVEVLNGTFLQDWELETREGMTVLETADIRTVEPAGTAVAQVLPSGPGLQRENLHEMLVALLYAAERELILTTPYFVPDERMLRALESAARRGVAVTLMVPERLDSILVRFAGASAYELLMEAGMRIFRYRPGLLHTKLVTVDGRIATVGSMNLDMRSLWLNFELSVVLYDQSSVAEIRALQQAYLADSTELDLASWRQRPRRHRVGEGVLRLFGPLV